MRTLIGSATASTSVACSSHSLGAGQRARHRDHMHSSAGSGMFDIAMLRSRNLSAGRRVRHHDHTRLGGSEMFHPLVSRGLQPRGAAEAHLPTAVRAPTCDPCSKVL